MDITFQYPPDLFSLLVDTIPRLCRSKKDVVLFFRGAGVERQMYVDFEQKVKSDPTSVTKFDIARAILTRLNARGEPTIRERREVLKRITEFEQFDTCWDNDRLQARGLVAEVREVVGVKDSFTRMHIERDRERQERQLELRKKQKADEERLGKLRSVREEFARLFGERDRHARGRLLEGVLNRLFAAHDMSVREAFTLRGSEDERIVEQIDGVVEIDGDLYLVEVKWWGEALGPAEISQHLVRVYHRGHARGIFIANAGYTPAAQNICKEALQRTVVILCELSEFVLLLERELPLRPFFKEKIQAAVIERKPLHRPLS